MVVRFRSSLLEKAAGVLNPRHFLLLRSKGTRRRSNFQMC